MLLDEYARIPYKVINFLGAEINYGGRVTDDKDVRLIKSILKQYINAEVFFICLFGICCCLFWNYNCCLMDV